jgi:hypothetical protein
MVSILILQEAQVPGTSLEGSPYPHPELVLG